MFFKRPHSWHTLDDRRGLTYMNSIHKTDRTTGFRGKNRDFWWKINSMCCLNAFLFRLCHFTPYYGCCVRCDRSSLSFADRLLCSVLAYARVLANFVDFSFVNLLLCASVVCLCKGWEESFFVSLLIAYKICWWTMQTWANFVIQSIWLVFVENISRMWIYFAMFRATKFWQFVMRIEFIFLLFFNSFSIVAVCWLLWFESRQNKKPNRIKYTNNET